MHAEKSILFESCAEIVTWHGAKGGGTSGDQFTIYNGSEKGAMCQNGTLETLLDAIVTPPFPHRAPTVPPPYPVHTHVLALCVPFWHSSACPRHPNAGMDWWGLMAVI